MFIFKKYDDGDYKMSYNGEESEMLSNLLMLLSNGQAEFTGDEDATWESCISFNREREEYYLWFTADTFNRLINLFDTADIRYKVHKKVFKY